MKNSHERQGYDLHEQQSTHDVSKMINIGLTMVGIISMIDALILLFKFP